MLKSIGLSIALVVAGALPAMAQAACTAPIAPASVDGNTVTKEALIAAVANVKAFLAASDAYQDCLNNDLKAQKDKAAAAKVAFDPSIEASITAKGNDNQAQKEKVGNEINAAVTAYKKAHPG